MTELAGVRVGVEMTHWLGQVPVESLWVAMGGFPPSLQASLSEGAAKLRCARVPATAEWLAALRAPTPHTFTRGVTTVAPMFVFDGLDVVRAVPLPNHTAAVAAAWAAHRGTLTSTTRRRRNRSDFFPQANGSVDAFAALAPTATDGAFAAAAVAFFRSQGAECIRAPYRAWAQLAYLVQHQHLDAVWGSTENLLFAGVRRGKLILSVDWVTQSFDWVDGPLLLDALGVTEASFLDACLLAGTLLTPPIPAVMPGTFDRCFKAARNAEKFIQELTPPVVRDVPGLPNELMEKLLWARVVFKHHLIMYEACRVEPLDTEHVPEGADRVLGHKLPDSMYYLLTEAVVRVTLVNAFVTGHLVDTCPWTDSYEYRRLANTLLPLRARCVGLLAGGISGPVHNSLLLRRWYDAHCEYPVAVDASERLVYHALDSVLVGGATPTSASFADRMERALRSLGTVQHTKRPARIANHALLEHYVLAEGLRVAGCAAVAPALVAAAPLAADGDDWSESCVLLVELLRHGHLHGEPLGLPESMEASGGSGGDVATAVPVRLLSRVFSVLQPVRVDQRKWLGAIDADVAAFRSLVQLTVDSLRDTLDAVLLRVLLDHLSDLSPEETLSVATRMPFRAEPSACVGTFMKRVLQEPATYSFRDACHDFPNLLALRDDAARALRLWAKFRAVVRALAAVPDVTAALPSWGATMAAFTAADAYVEHVKSTAVFFRPPSSSSRTPSPISSGNSTPAASVEGPAHRSAPRQRSTSAASPRGSPKQAGSPRRSHGNRPRVPAVKTPAPPSPSKIVVKSAPVSPGPEPHRSKVAAKTATGTKPSMKQSPSKSASPKPKQ